MGSGASIPERLSLDDAKALVPSESWVDAWEQTYFVGGDGAVAEPKTVSRAKAERLWAKAERGVAALSQPGFERSVAGPPAYESDRVLPRCGDVDPGSGVGPLRPLEFERTVRRHLDAHLDGTREWIAATFEAWFLESALDESRLFWIAGAAGTGKSVALSLLLRRCAESRRCVAWHFCHHADPASSAPPTLVRSLAAMLCQRVAGFGDALAARFRERPEDVGGDADAGALYASLVTGPLHATDGAAAGFSARRPAVIFVDGLDELAGAARRDVVAARSRVSNDDSAKRNRPPPLADTERPRPRAPRLGAGLRELA